jgi:hypothetical protein
MTNEYYNSFALLTMHKAASVYVGDIFKEIFSRHGYGTFDPATAAFERGMSESASTAEQAMRLLEPDHFYGPFRAESAFLAAQIIPARPIIHVRDPRDCLVSLYYSLLFSHPVPGGAAATFFLQRRESLQAMTIDGFVRKCLLAERLDTREIGWGYRRFLRFSRALKAKRPETILSKYEDMVTEFPDWLVAIVGQLGIEIDYDIIIDLVERTNFLVNLRVEENHLQHKRQITPGDHRRKLCLETQEILTEFYAEELTCLGYL